MAISALAAGAGLAGFAIATPANGYPAWLAVASLALVGLGSIGYLTTANSSLQLRVPDRLMGRVMGLWVVVNAGTMPLGSLAFGGVAERFGLPVVVFWCGMVSLAIGALALLTRAFTGTRERPALTSGRERKQPQGPKGPLGPESITT